MADNSEKILNGKETGSQQEPFVDIYKQCCCMLGSSEQLTACVWLEETPPSPWPAEASQSHALGLLLQL